MNHTIDIKDAVHAIVRETLVLSSNQDTSKEIIFQHVLRTGVTSYEVWSNRNLITREDTLSQAIQEYNKLP